MARHRSTYRAARRNDVNVWMYRQEIPRGYRRVKSYYMRRL